MGAKYGGLVLSLSLALSSFARICVEPSDIKIEAEPKAYLKIRKQASPEGDMRAV